MAIATSFAECIRFAQSVTSIGGSLPKRLQGLLSGWEVLNAPAAPTRQDDPIVDACLAGTLTPAKLAELLPAASAAAFANQYRAGLGRSIENTLVGEWHRQLKKDGADQILDCLRKRFDEHATAIAEARSLINPESSPEHILASAQPAVIGAWQELDAHITAVAKIAVVAAHSGRSSASFPQIVEYSLADNFRVDDTALMVADGGLVADCALPAARRPALRLGAVQGEPEAAQHRVGYPALQRFRGLGIRPGPQRPPRRLHR